MGGGKGFWWCPFRTHVSHDGFATLHRDIDLPPTARRHQDGSLARVSIDLRTPQLETKVSGALSALLRYTVRGDPCQGPVLVAGFHCPTVLVSPARTRALRRRTCSYDTNGDGWEGPVSPFGLRLAIPSPPPRSRKTPACREKRFDMSDSRRPRGW